MPGVQLEVAPDSRRVIYEFDDTKPPAALLGKFVETSDVTVQGGSTLNNSGVLVRRLRAHGRRRWWDDNGNCTAFNYPPYPGISWNPNGFSYHSQTSWRGYACEQGGFENSTIVTETDWTGSVTWNSNGSADMVVAQVTTSTTYSGVTGEECDGVVSTS